MADGVGNQDGTLSDGEELAANVGGLLCVCAPLAFMAREQSKKKNAEVTEKTKKQTKKKTKDLAFANPMMDAEDLD